jgi:hypothetical protein
VLNVYVGPLDDLPAARPLTNDRRQGIQLYGFCPDDRTLWYLRDSDGDENWLLYLVDLDSGEQHCVTPFERVSVDVLRFDWFHPTELLLAINKGQPRAARRLPAGPDRPVADQGGDQSRLCRLADRH